LLLRSTVGGSCKNDGSDDNDGGAPQGSVRCFHVSVREEMQAFALVVAIFADGNAEPNGPSLRGNFST